MFRKLFKKYTIDDFASEVIKEYRRQGYTKKIVWDNEKARLQFEDDDFFNLENTYLEQKVKTPVERRAFLQKYIAELIDREKLTWDGIENKILPRVRTLQEFAVREYYIRVESSRDVNDDPLFSDYWRIGADLAIELVVDREASIQSLPLSELKEMGVSVEQARGKALSNLTTMSQELFSQASPGVWVSPWQDNYDACRILLTDTIQTLAIKGDTIIFIPNRDTLLVVGSDDIEGMKNVIDMLSGSAESERVISFTPYRLYQGAIDFFQFDESHPLFNELKLLQVQSLLADYEEQKSWLVKIFEKENKDVFVAGYTAIQQNDTGKIVSWASWSDGVPTYLPKVDMVALGRGNTDEDYSILGFVPWAQFYDELSDYIEETDYYPRRYFVKDFPDDEELAKLDFREL